MVFALHDDLAGVVALAHQIGGAEDVIQGGEKRNIGLKGGVLHAVGSRANAIAGVPAQDVDFVVGAAEGANDEKTLHLGFACGPYFVGVDVGFPDRGVDVIRNRGEQGLRRHVVAVRSGNDANDVQEPDNG